jgi:hypothetical protein
MNAARILALTILLASCANEHAPARAAVIAAAAQEADPNSPTDRLLVRTARLEIERSDPEAGARGAAEVAKRLGGWVKSSSSQAATLVVPADKLDACLGELAKLGDVKETNVTGEDVTDEFHDVHLHLDNLLRERDRYLELLSRAANVTEATVVEKELERVTLEIERLKGRVQVLEQGIRYSTVDASFARPVRPGPVGWVFYGLFQGVKWLLVWD